MTRNQIVGAIVLAASAAALVAFGIVGVGRGGVEPQSDFEFYYAAGRAWNEGGNPYDVAVNREACWKYGGLVVENAMGYPPHFAPLAMFFGAFDHATSRALFLAMNLILIASLCVLATKWVTNAEVSRPATSAPATRWLMPALVLGNPFMQHQLWLGQMTIWACVFLTWAWYFAVRKREIVAGALLALATMKPNLAPLPLLWLVLERRWKTLVSASVFGVLLSLPVWADLGPIGATRQWMHALSTYSPAVTSASGPGANELGHPHVIGLPSALVSVGIPMPGQGVLLGVATVFTIGLWLGRRRIVADDVFGLLVALELGFVFAHDAELLYLVPTAAAVWLHVAHRSRARLAAALCTLVLFVPQRFLRGIDSPLLQHWRTAIVLIAIASLIWMSWRETQLIETDERSS